MRALRLLIALLLLPVLAAPGLAREEETSPSAAQVVVRGKKDLADALEVCVGIHEEAPPPVLFIVDVTPYTAAAEDALTLALIQLDKRVRHEGSWRMAPLGQDPGPAVSRPGRLAPRLPRLLAKTTDAVATIPALDRTVKRLGEKGVTIVYLADWRFEDDVRLEPFIQRLRRAGHTFHVVGSEACFTRAWNDGFYPPDRGAWIEAEGRSKLYADEIGRSPFGAEDLAVPWHGGDTAWPHIPIRFAGVDFSTRFPVMLRPLPARRASRYAEPWRDPRGGEPTPEDLADRQKEGRDEEALERYWFPLPSSFGSYPLMRAAAMTGGRYVLWSWNPSGRSDLKYDYSRCNLFAPDLRSRAVVRKDVRKRPLAIALVKAWHHLGNDVIQVTSTTPPLAFDGRGALEMRHPRGSLYLHYGWDTKKEYRSFLATAPRYLAAMKKAADGLDRALRTPIADAVDRRYHADAMLLRHILRLKDFHLREAVARARTLDTGKAWRNLPLHPVLDHVHWVRSGRDPHLAIPYDIEVFDLEAGARVLAERKLLLEKYAGTPHGELVARNALYTFDICWVGYASGRPTKGSPSESEGEPQVTPPGRGSGGTGPTTGR